MCSVPASLNFNLFCLVLEKISSKKKNDDKRALLKKFMEEWRGYAKQNAKALSKPFLPDDSFYPAMRLLIPSLDKDRGAYGVKETLLAKRLCDALMIDSKSPDFAKLKNFQSPKNVAHGITDFGAIAEEVLRTRLAPHGHYSILEINDRLDAIAIANADKDSPQINNILIDLLKHVEASELKWLCRILLKQVRLGISETAVFSCFHPESSQLFDVTSSLRKVCEQLYDPSIKLDEIQVQLFSAFRPMLADRVPIAKVPEMMNNGKFFIEIKYDGERVQLHKQGDKYRYFSRNGIDYTSAYGATSQSGSLTPYIHDRFKNVNTCILDGEMVGWYKEANCIAYKGEKFDVKALRDTDDICPCYVVFDCLMLNDKVYSTTPLVDRLNVLTGLFTELEGRLLYTSRKDASTKEEVAESLNFAIEHKEEGIIVKDPQSTYKLNTRAKSGWLKIKPDYIDALMDDLDLLILGGYQGDGRRANVLSHFLLGVAVKADNEGENPSRFQTIAKVGSGYSDQELNDLNMKLRKCQEKQYNRKNLPPWIEVARESCDCWFDYKQSSILQVRAAEFIQSDNYATKYTLRFPRVEKIRKDKSWYDCMTADEFHKQRNAARNLVELKSVGDDGDAGVTSPKKRRVGRVVAKPTLGAQFQAADLTNIKKLSNVFSGKEFCVIQRATAEISKIEIEKKIAELGGMITQNVGQSTFCVITGEKSIKANNIIKTKQYNVVKVDWLVRCSTENRWILWEPADFWFATDETKKLFSIHFDESGDSYTEPVDFDRLKKIVDQAPQLFEIDSEEVYGFEQEIDFEWKYNIFRGVRLFVHEGSMPIPSPLELPSLECRMHGGRLIDSIADCTHVLVHSTESQMTSIVEKNRTRLKKFAIVTENWITESIQRDEKLAVREFYPSEKKHDYVTFH